jgi:hypothetical protein
MAWGLWPVGVKLRAALLPGVALFGRKAALARTQLVAETWVAHHPRAGVLATSLKRCEVGAMKRALKISCGASRAGSSPAVWTGVSSRSMATSAAASCLCGRRQDA